MNELKKIIREKGEVQMKATKNGEVIFGPVLSRHSRESDLMIAVSDAYTLQSVGWSIEVLA
jgi:hypothetical protein